MRATATKYRENKLNVQEFLAELNVAIFFLLLLLLLAVPKSRSHSGNCFGLSFGFSEMIQCNGKPVLC